MNSGRISVEKKPLYVPDLQELADVFHENLKQNFEQVTAEVVDCPDLTQKPFTLASIGLNGNARLVEVGGPPYLLPLVNRDKVYDLKSIAKLMDLRSSFMIGAGAGPFPYSGSNCEGIINIRIDEDKVDQHTRIVKVISKDGGFIQERLPDTETRFAILGNYYSSDGKPGKVVKVHVKRRIGKDDFVSSLRNSLTLHFGKDKVVGLGGTFLLKTGQAKQHVMPDFSSIPIASDDELNRWLKFYNMSAPLIAVGTMVSDEYDLDLRVQHFHSFSHHGQGGHYHNDVTPDTAEYLGYFHPAETIYRMDRPANTHHIGRD